MKFYSEILRQCFRLKTSYIYIYIGTQISAVTCWTVHEHIVKVTYGKVIKSLQEGESYKYLGILEAERFLGEEMKLKVSKEYFRRLIMGI